VANPFPSRHVLLARLLAEQLHDGQERLDGAPYFGHIERVAAAVYEHGNRARIVAYLHDVVEDTNFRLAYVYLLFGEEVGNDVAALTRDDEEGYQDYVGRVLAGSDAVVLVKLADVRDNLPNAPASLGDRYVLALSRLVEEAAARGILRVRSRSSSPVS
jgi:(p)ppGpp synthase/HD superfamily hydrolase